MFFRKRVYEKSEIEIKLTPTEKSLYNIFLEEYNDLFENIFLLSEKALFTKMSNYVAIAIGDKLNDYNKLTQAKVLSAIKGHHYMPDLRDTKKIREIITSLGSNDNQGVVERLSKENYTPHCINTSKAYHTCGNELLRPQATSTDYIFCLQCKKIFKPDQIHLLCKECDVEYFSALVESNNEDANANDDDEYLPATWETYHCKGVVDAKMKCPKCRETLLYNSYRGTVKCSGCEYLTNPTKIPWKCTICKDTFYSRAKPYDEVFTYKPMKICIRNALEDKIPARPTQMACSCSLDIKRTNFNHKRECNGVLYLGTLNNNKIVVCSKCRAVIYYQRNNWYCPKCDKKFKCEGGNEEDEDDDTTNNTTNNNVIINMNNYHSNNTTPSKINLSGTRNGNSSNHNNVQHFSGSSDIKRYKDNELTRAQTQKTPSMFLLQQNNNENKSFVHDKSNIINRVASNIGASNNNNTNDNIRNRILRNEHGEIVLESVHPNTKAQSSKAIPKISNHNNSINNSNNNNNNNNVPSRVANSSKNISHVMGLRSKGGVSSFNINVNSNIVNNIKKNFIEPSENFSIDEFTILNQIGEGTFGKIYDAIYSKNDTHYALKKIYVKTEEEIDKLKQEYNLVMNFFKKNKGKNFNIVKVYGVQSDRVQSTNVLYALMELGSTDWEKEIAERGLHKQFYTEGELRTILHEIVRTMAELQKYNITHRDIKPQNILKVNGSYKICDFGEACIVDQSEKVFHTVRGTELYMSPILFNALKKGVNKIKHDCFKSDVFSLGLCVLFAGTLTFKSLYAIRELQDMGDIKNILTRYLIARYSFEFVDILMKMLEYDERKRMTFIELEEILR